MGHRLPSLNALKAFETTARCGSVTRAAEELAVTQPAVTQQIKALEAFLGARLFMRDGQGVALTNEGRAYAARLLPAFAEIDAATRDLFTQPRRSSALTVSLLPTLAQRWLIPRLGSFQERHPEIEVRFSATAALVDLQRDDIDLAIRFGEGRWPGCDATFLMSNDMFPVIAPRLQSRQPVKDVSDLAHHVLLRVDAEPRTDDWPVWLDAAGAHHLEPRSWLSFESSSQALAAAAAGIGVAIGHRPFVMDDLSAGRLIQPLAPVVESAQAYYAVTASGKPETSRVEAFLEWLVMEAGALRGAEAEAPL